ncbi:MAG TPA: hypothetical protein VF746_06215 [Longimicrobium sp.]|jgi:hypothetical protein
MPHPIPRDESPHRGRAEDRRRLGPYETVYDIRRGYDLPVRERRRGAGDVLLFRGREEEGAGGKGG